MKDDPMEVMRHAGRYVGGRALIVLGGDSGKRWEQVRDQVRPDVIIGANGTCYQINNLDYWVLAENLSRSYGCWKEGREEPERHAEFVRLLTHPHNAWIKMVNYINWKIMQELEVNTLGCVRITRRNDEWLDDLLREPGFSLREYGAGFINGWLLRKEGAGVRVRVGTVALQCMHLAGILGVSEIHTIGYDLMSRRTSGDHWYKHPKYKPDHFRSEAAFIERAYGGRVVRTQWFWLETAQYMREVGEPLLAREGIRWRDHSNGLLKLEGLECTKF